MSAEGTVPTPYAVSDERWAKRQAARERDRAKMDAFSAEMAERERMILRADAMTDLLPGRIGAAVSALFEAIQPIRMDDGGLSYCVVGRTSNEVVALAAAIVEYASEAPA